MEQEQEDPRYQQLAQQLEEELIEEQKKTRSMAKAQLGMYENESEDNLAKFQLNMIEEKMRIYHLLKAHRLEEDEKGQEVWVEPDDRKSAILNDYGVDYIMYLYDSFINKNIVLSDFEEERIYEILYDLGMAIIHGIFNDYEDFGLDTDSKRKRFDIIVLGIMTNIEATLNRAKSGGERRTIRAITTITQNETPQRYQNIPQVNNQQRRRMFHPSTW